MEGLMFPKPVKAEKQRKRLRCKPRKEKVWLPGPAAAPYQKPPTIKDPALLKRYAGRPCVWPGCGDHRDTHAHHFVPRSHQQLDIDQNLSPLCPRHHAMIEEGSTVPGSGELLEVVLLLAEKTIPALQLLYRLAPRAWIWKELPEVAWYKICE